METTRDTRPIAAGAALAFALSAAVALTVGDAIWRGIPASDAVPALLMMLGWLLLTWAVIVAGFVIVRIVRAASRRGTVAHSELLLVGASAVVIAALILVYPVIGSGGGTG